MPDERKAGGRVRFGLYELDYDSQQLRHDGIPCRLQPQPFKVLALLVSTANRVVTREDLRHELWGDETFVDFEQGLNYCIRQIRAVLGDEAQSPRYIETIPRRGYRFIAPVEGATAAMGDKASESSIHPQSRPGTIRWLVIIPAVLVLALVGVIAVVRASRHPPLTEKDYLLITEFSNQTGDPIFDATLRKAVAIDLGQSPYLNIVPDEKIRQTLGLMGRPPDTRVTPEIGREICQRNGVKAMLTGSLASLGNQYQLALEVVNVSSGDILAEERVQAAGKEQVLNVLGGSNDRLRKKLGESLASIQQFGRPLEQATTSSLEALHLYTLGVEKRVDSELGSVPFFEQAIQLDPNFALAHARLGTVYINLEQLQLAEEHEKKAVALSDRVSERERLYITAHYYLLIGQRDRVIETYETYAGLYPRDPEPEANLANEYNILGRFEEALQHALHGLRLSPESAGVRGEAASSYQGLGRLDEARAIIVEGLRVSPNSSYLHLCLSNIALAQGDTATRSREDAAVKATPGGNLDLVYRDASLAAAQGKLRQSEDLYSQASQTALKLGLKDNASFALGLRAVYEAYLGESARAKASADAALKLSQMSDTIEPVAIGLAVSGESKQAETLIDNLAKRRPEDTIIHFIYAPTVHALGLLHRGDADGAIRLLAAGVPYDRGNLDAMLVRANALLQAKRAKEAADEFRRIVSLRPHSPNDPTCALAQLGLARAYARGGDQPASRVAYQDFLALWKDADPDLPPFKKAQAEYAALQ